MGGGRQAIEELQKRNLIAYHFADEFHDNIEDYPEQTRGLTQAFNAFHAINKTGCIVVAEYTDPASFVAGMIKPGTKTEPLTLNGSDGEVVYKTMSYENPKRFRYADYPLLAAIRPPYSTICSTGRSFSQIIKHIYSGETIELAVDFMHPSSIELMCDTFLKSELAPADVRLEYALLRTGKTMPAVDIYGRSISGKKVFAQVTYAASAPSKLELLIGFANGTGMTVYFSRDKKVSHPGLNYHFNIDEVFKKMLESGLPAWRRMLREMVGLDRD